MRPTNWLRQKVRDTDRVRSVLMQVMALGRDPSTIPACLITVMYHDMPPSTRESFEQQLRYMRSLGKFVTADQAVDLLTGRKPLDQRYFCLTFDDGYQNAYRYALPILREHNVPSIFFVVPKWLSEASVAGPDRQYMTWDECRALRESGAMIGSHSVSHRRLALLDAETARYELEQSKKEIERRLGTSCHHFACPWGQPTEDYVPTRDPLLAVELGYNSFFTTLRGPATIASSPWEIPRVRLEPGWELAQLRVQFTRRPFFAANSQMPAVARA